MSNRVGPAASAAGACTATAVGLALTGTVGTGCCAMAIAAPVAIARIAPKVTSLALGMEAPLLVGAIRPGTDTTDNPRCQVIDTGSVAATAAAWRACLRFRMGVRWTRRSIQR